MEGDGANNKDDLRPGATISPGFVDNSANVQASVNIPREDPVSETANTQLNDTVPPPQEITGDEVFSWTGPEFAQHDKSPAWYLMFIIVAVVLGGIIYVSTKDAISSIAVAFALSVLGLYSLRKPKDISYMITDYGITVGPKRFSYEEFRSFTVNTEGAYLSVTFLPLRRFATTAGLFYQGQDEDNIVNFLSERLPLEKHKPDIIESFMQRIRF